MNRLTPDQIDKALAMIGSGMSLTQVSYEFGFVSSSSLRYWIEPAYRKRCLIRNRELKAAKKLETNEKLDGHRED